jgi:hypothetical protein
MGNNAVGSVGFALPLGCAEQLRQDSGCEAGHGRLACAWLLIQVHRWPPAERVWGQQRRSTREPEGRDDQASEGSGINRESSEGTQSSKVSRFMSKE